MFKKVKQWTGDLVHLLLPHICTGCGSDVLGNEDLLCLKCHSQLPHTHFFKQGGNPVEQMFYGRLNVEEAAAAFFFTKNSLLQHLVVQLKYRGNKDVGHYLGRIAANSLLAGARFTGIDCIVPLPLNPRKERKRGYNQATWIGKGIADHCGWPVVENVVLRTRFTTTQTHKSRVDRWKNMDGVFVVNDPLKLEGKHILLIDDVVTTGATLESCGREILKVPGAKLSIVTLSYTLL